MKYPSFSVSTTTWLLFIALHWLLTLPLPLHLIYPSYPPEHLHLQPEFSSKPKLSVLLWAWSAIFYMSALPSPRPTDTVISKRLLCSLYLVCATQSLRLQLLLLQPLTGVPLFSRTQRSELGNKLVVNAIVFWVGFPNFIYNHSFCKGGLEQSK